MTTPLTPHVAGVANQPPQGDWAGAKTTKNYSKLCVSYNTTTMMKATVNNL